MAGIENVPIVSLSRNDCSIHDMGHMQLHIKLICTKNVLIMHLMKLWLRICYVGFINYGTLLLIKLSIESRHAAANRSLDGGLYQHHTSVC